MALLIAKPVSRVVSSIVKATNGMDDDRVAADVRACLATCGYRAIQKIECEVRFGILTLRGYVSSYYLKQLAQEFGRRVSGVRGVMNCVVVEHEVTHGKDCQSS